MSQQRISLLGATGSIGASTLRVVERYPDRLKVVALSAGTNAAGLVALARRWEPEAVCIADPAGLPNLKEGLRGSSCKILSGPEGLEEIAAWPSADTTVVAVVGFAGVRPTLAAIAAGKKIALANKETLVAAGALVMARAREHGVSLVPIDSEHSAIWQCLRAGEEREVKRLILTASGGPFRHRPVDTFDTITPAEALAHPTWKMGPRITVDSATMMNKGFEVLEAAWLFDIEPDRIDVVIHPESIIHSMVEFHDGSIVAHLGAPDMAHPITYALFAPERLPVEADTAHYDPTSGGELHFEAVASERYPALALARRAWAAGATGGTVLNAADEVAVEAFQQGGLSFPEITILVDRVLREHTVVNEPGIDDIEAADRWARDKARALISERAVDGSLLVREPAGRG
jgi:1-deoxy-D-xylulose-5-phosphate reductoisomerase